MTQCERKKCGEYNMLRCAREAGHAGECSFVVDRENDYPWNKLPKERECCGTFPRTPHRSTCAKYRGKAKPSNVELSGPKAALKEYRKKVLLEAADWFDKDAGVYGMDSMWSLSGEKLRRMAEE